MPNEIATYNSTENVVVYSSADNAVHLDVQLADETVWLTQQQIATLFGVQIPAVSKHLSNIFREGELDKNSVISILENTATDGKKYRTMFYNLDAILSVGRIAQRCRQTPFRLYANGSLADKNDQNQIITNQTKTNNIINFKITNIVPLISTQNQIRANIDIMKHLN